MSAATAKLLFDRDCVFCQRVVNGKYDEGDRDAVIFAPRHPVTPGHMLIVPRLHVTDAAADADVTAATMRLAAVYAVRSGVDFNLITSRGHLATQTVFHLHIHFVPRRENDGLTLPWTGQLKPDGRVS
ncbi:HIT family protein [Lentzea chajnantorensis]